jgi:hypothetical protein
MTSFVEFVINVFNYFGVFYVFAILFLFVIVYAFSSVVLTSFQRGNSSLFDEKTAKALSSLIAISVSVLAVYVSNVVILIQYFLAMSSVLLIVLFFIILLASFVWGERKAPSKDYSLAVSVMIIILITAFIFIALFYAYQDVFVQINVGKANATSTQLFGLVWKPEVLLIPFIFVMIGFAVWIAGREEGKKESGSS